MQVLLLSAYDAGSHRYWREGLVAAFPDIEWTILALPARYFSWRIRGNSLSWAFTQREVLQRPYDLLIATSMVDLSALRGFVPELARLPTIVYFHENQFAYPLNNNASQQTVEPQIVNLYSALCADLLLFNSEYNRSSFLEGVEKLLKKLPDQVPGQLMQILQHSEVLPVPIADALFDKGRQRGRNKTAELSLVWNHRWEYDKGPERLLGLIKALTRQAIPFRLSVLGEQFRTVPDSFVQLKQFMDEHCPGSLQCWGYVADRQAYYQLLLSADIVLSTALHDFQGIAMLEGLALGCVPLAPARLSYPEVLGESCCYASCPDNAEQEIAAMVSAIMELMELKSRSQLPVSDAGRYSWSVQRGRYAEAMMKAIRRRKRGVD